MDRYERKLALLFGAVMLLLGGSISLVYWVGQIALRSNLEISGRRAAIEQVERTFSAVKDAESGQRG